MLVIAHKMKYYLRRTFKKTFIHSFMDHVGTQEQLHIMLYVLCVYGDARINRGSRITFHCLGTKDQIQFIRLRARCLYPVNQFFQPAIQGGPFKPLLSVSDYDVITSLPSSLTLDTQGLREHLLSNIYNSKDCLRSQCC